MTPGTRDMTAPNAVGTLAEFDVAMGQLCAALIGRATGGLGIPAKSRGPLGRASTSGGGATACGDSNAFCGSPVGEVDCASCATGAMRLGTGSGLLSSAGSLSRVPGSATGASGTFATIARSGTGFGAGIGADNGAPAAGCTAGWATRAGPVAWRVSL